MHYTFFLKKYSGHDIHEIFHFYQVYIHLFVIDLGFKEYSEFEKCRVYESCLRR